MTFKQVFRQTLNQIKAKIHEEFDKNFEKKAFFDQRWKEAKFPHTRGTLMARTNTLRRSIRSQVQGNSIVFSSSMPYAQLHNEGGEVIVTPKMKKYFWFMYQQTTHSMAKKKNGDFRNNKQNRSLSAQAQMYKALALKKVGEKIKIEKRQFIGNHPRVETIIKRYFFVNVGKYLKSLDFKKL